MSKLIALCAAAALGVAMTQAAHAQAVGEADLSITNGTFTYAPGGGTTTTLAGPQQPYIEDFVGGYTFTDTLPSPDSVFNYIVAGSVGDGGSSTSLFVEPPTDLGWTSLNALAASDPLAAAGAGLFGTLLEGNPNTLYTANIDGFAFSIEYTITGEPANGYSGSFELFSDTDYGSYAEENGVTLADDSGINANFSITAVPEPASMALLGVGLAGLGVIRRRRRV